MAGSNWFSDLLSPVSDLIESIPIVGQVIEWADKFALNTDPSQLSTAAFGKLVGGDTEEYYTSEKARKGASHNIGAAALAYILGGGAAAGGASGGTGAAAVPAGEAGYGTAATYGVTEAAGGMEAPGLMAQILGGSSAAVPEGVAGYGTASTYGVGPAAGGIAEQGTLSKLLSNKLIMQYLSNAGKDLSAYGGNTDKGMQFTNTNAVTTDNIRARSLSKLIAETLGTDKPKAPLGGEESALRKFVMYDSALGYGRSTPKRTLLSDPEPEPEEDRSKLRWLGSSYKAANPFGS